MDVVHDLLFAAVGIGAGLIFLVAGSKLLVRGAFALAALLRISPLVIRLTSAMASGRRFFAYIEPRPGHR